MSPRKSGELLQYEEESAGGIMTTDVLKFRDTQSVREALEQIAVSAEDEPIYNAYIVDQADRLVGVIELWEMLKIRDKSAALDDVAHDDVVSVETSLDQEEVARVIAKYDLAAVPVVDDANKLVGRVTVDDVIDVVEEEATEDIFRLAGSDDAELLHRTPWHASRIRLPWLLVTMAITFCGESHSQAVHAGSVRSPRTELFRPHRHGHVWKYRHAVFNTDHPEPGAAHVRGCGLLSLARTRNC